MTAPCAARLAAPAEVFAARCKALATLAAAGDVDLVKSIDRLQAAAAAAGLVDQYGQDAVQAFMADAFAVVRRPGEAENLFRQLAAEIEERARRRPGCPLQRQTRAHQRRAADETTVDALAYSLRTRGAAALDETATQRRLGDLSSKQVADLLNRLVRLRSQYPVIDDVLIERLGEQL